MGCAIIAELENIKMRGLSLILGIFIMPTITPITTLNFILFLAGTMLIYGAGVFGGINYEKERSKNG
jgi:hypothetical protein